MADEALKAFGRIDILVTNAGIFTSLVPDPFEQLTVAQWRKGAKSTSRFPRASE
jgi:NAD(P)-dependent dehydrogenase (short-subunit alcohol dehydrogenase family)